MIVFFLSFAIRSIDWSPWGRWRRAHCPVFIQRWRSLQSGAGLDILLASAQQTFLREMQRLVASCQPHASTRLRDLIIEKSAKIKYTYPLISVIFINLCALYDQKYVETWPSHLNEQSHLSWKQWALLWSCTLPPYLSSIKHYCWHYWKKKS